MDRSSTSNADLKMNQPSAMYCVNDPRKSFLSIDTNETFLSFITKSTSITMATSLQGSFVKLVNSRVAASSQSGYLLIKYAPSAATPRPLDSVAVIPSISLHFQSSQLSPNTQSLVLPSLSPKSASLIPALRSVMHTYPRLQSRSTAI